MNQGLGCLMEDNSFDAEVEKVLPSSQSFTPRRFFSLHLQVNSGLVSFSNKFKPAAHKPQKSHVSTSGRERFSLLFGVLASDCCCMMKYLHLHLLRGSQRSLPIRKSIRLEAVTADEFICCESIASKQKLHKLRINWPWHLKNGLCL